MPRVFSNSSDKLVGGSVTCRDGVETLSLMVEVGDDWPVVLSTTFREMGAEAGGAGAGIVGGGTVGGGIVGAGIVGAGGAAAVAAAVAGAVAGAGAGAVVVVVVVVEAMAGAGVGAGAEVEEDESEEGDIIEGSRDEIRFPQSFDFRLFLWVWGASGASEESCRTAWVSWLDSESSESRRLERSTVWDLCHFFRGSLVEEVAVEEGSELVRRTEREEGKREARKDLLDVILGSMTVQQSKQATVKLHASKQKDVNRNKNNKKMPSMEKLRRAKQARQGKGGSRLLDEICMSGSSLWLRCQISDGVLFFLSPPADYRGAVTGERFGSNANA